MMLKIGFDDTCTYTDFAQAGEMVKFLHQSSKGNTSLSTIGEAQNQKLNHITYTIYQHKLRKKVSKTQNKRSQSLLDSHTKGNHTMRPK